MYKSPEVHTKEEEEYQDAYQALLATLQDGTFSVNDNPYDAAGLQILTSIRKAHRKPATLPYKNELTHWLKVTKEVITNQSDKNITAFNDATAEAVRLSVDCRPLSAVAWSMLALAGFLLIAAAITFSALTLGAGAPFAALGLALVIKIAIVASAGVVGTTGLVAGGFFGWRANRGDTAIAMGNLEKKLPSPDW